MSGLDQSRLAPDDSRRLMPKPEFDESKRKSGFPAYSSPRPARVARSYGGRKADGYVQWFRGQAVAPFADPWSLPAPRFVPLDD
jgi:hypothetical protein